MKGKFKIEKNEVSKKDLLDMRAALLNMLEDMTQSKKEIEALKDYSESIIANIPSAILIFDKNLKYISANDTFYDHFRMKPKEIIGKSISEVLSPQMIKTLRIKKNILSAFKTGKIIEEFGLEYTMRSADKRILNVKYVPLLERQQQLMVIIDDITEMKKLEKDKKILIEKVAKLTKKVPLTNNEKLVFYGLVKYPLLADQQLSNNLKIKRSTITSIKNKLLRRGFYSTYAIPNFALIGCELMCILSGKGPVEQKEAALKKIVASPEVVYDIRTDKEFLSIIVSKNFVETKRMVDYISISYEGGDIEEPHITYFPFATSRISSLFDYSTLLKSLFNLNIKKENTKLPVSKKRKLSNNEKIVLYALTKYPQLTNSELATKIKLSRPTLSQIKNNLIKDNFLKIINIPDIKKLNCELLLYSNTKMYSKKPETQNKDIPSLIFMANNERENSSMFIFENFTGYKVEYDKLIALLKRDWVIIEDSKNFLLPIQQIKSQKIAFAPLIKKVFELNVNF